MEKAWQLIENPENWTTKVNARDKDGRCVSEFSSKACKWCAYGALIRTYGKGSDLEEVFNLVDQTCGQKHQESGVRMCVTEVNDKLGHAVILALLKELDV